MKYLQIRINYSNLASIIQLITINNVMQSTDKAKKQRNHVGGYVGEDYKKMLEVCREVRLKQSRIKSFTTVRVIEEALMCYCKELAPDLFDSEGFFKGLDQSQTATA